MPHEDAEHPLRVHCSQWTSKINLGRKFKKSEFDNYAEEGMDFYTGGESPKKFWERWMTGDNGVTDGEAPRLGFQFNLAKVAELVQIYGPGLYHRNPVRNVTPRKLPQLPPELFGNPQDPFVQQQHAMAMQSQGQAYSVASARAKLMETYLNFTPNELDLKYHSRKAIDETLIKGMGVLWHESYQPFPGGHTLVGSFYDTVDRLVVDPDAETFADCWWVARKCIHPVWEVARKYGLDEEELLKHGTTQSYDSAGEAEGRREKGEVVNRRGKSNDLLCYYKVYSRMGMGDRLSGTDKAYRGTLDELGENVYLVVADGIPYPLNVPPGLIEEAAEDEEKFQELFERVQWPIPFWMDGKDCWPFTPLVFHEIPNHVWPMAHIRPGLPELKFNNWTMSFTAENAYHTSRLFAGVRKSEEQDNKQKLQKGGGFTVMEFSETEAKNINEALSFASPPKGTMADLLAVNEKVEENFDKRTGLTELMYAMPGGMRSATEAQLKEGARNVRPDDMANKVEDWMSRVARKEALAAAWLLEAEDVLPVLGPAGAQLWEQLVVSADPTTMAMEFDYRIEAGSARKPNKDTLIYNVQQMVNVVLPLLVPFSQQTGDVRPINAFIKIWAEANDIHDWEQFQLQPPPPPQPDPSVQAKMQIEQQKLQAELMKIQGEMQLKGMDAQAKQIDMVLKQMELQFKEREAEMKLAMEREKHTLEMAHEEHKLAFEGQRFEQEMIQDQQIHEREMQQASQQSQLKLAMDRKMGDAKVENAKKMQAAKPKPKAGSKA